MLQQLPVKKAEFMHTLKRAHETGTEAVLTGL